MTTPEAALATRHVKGQTWDSGSPEAVDGFITWCKGCGQRPWPCDTRKALDLLEAALTPLAPEVPPRRDGLREVRQAIESRLADARMEGYTKYLVPGLEAALIAFDFAATRTPEGVSPKAAEPPDSGDGAARSRSVIRRENVQAGRPMNEGIEPRDAGIDAALLARAWHGAFHRYKDPNDSSCDYDAERSEPLAAEYNRILARRSGSPAPSGGTAGKGGE